MPDPIAALGDDVFLLILEHVPPTTTLSLHNVSHSWRDFLLAHDVWRGLCRRGGIDVREHRHLEAERAAAARNEPYSGELDGEPTSDEHRRALLGCARLDSAWTKRYAYENLVKAPAFKLRSVYLDDGEDYVYALTESSMSSREECLLVLNKYNGNLLQRIPGIRAHADVSVGAGYVAVTSNPRDMVTDRRREYSPIGEVTVFRTKTAAKRANAPWRDRGPLEYACTLSDEDITTCERMAVRLVRDEGVLVAADVHTAHIVNLDTGRRRSIPLQRVDTIDSPQFRETDMSYKEPRAWSLNITNDHIFVLTQHQLHIFTHTGSKVAAYPDPCAAYRTHAGLAYSVAPRYPYGHEHTRAPDTPDSAPPGITVAETLQWEIAGTHPDTHAYSVAVEQALGYDIDDFSDVDSEDEDSNEWHRVGRYRLDGMNATLQEVVFTMSDMVIRGYDGAIFIVRDYSRVLREALELKFDDRAAFIGRHSVIIGFHEPMEVVATHGTRLVAHAANSIAIVMDTAQLPPMPWTHDESEPIPEATVYAFEVSSLEGMQDESSIVMDARAVYMADWDKGMPDDTVEYEHLNNMHRDEDSWPYAIRPNWGCIKVWTFRPEAALLRRPVVREWAEALRKAYDEQWNQQYQWVGPTSPMDWDIHLGPIAQMLGEDVSWREEEEQEQEEIFGDVAMMLGEDLEWRDEDESEEEPEDEGQPEIQNGSEAEENSSGRETEGSQGTGGGGAGGLEEGIGAVGLEEVVREMGLQ